VMEGMDLQEALAYLDMIPDCHIAGDAAALYIHRTLPDGELYFISNQLDSPISITAEFRTEGKQPELWNAVDGTVRTLPEFAFGDRTTTVPLRLAAYESAFIIFREPISTEPANDAGKRN